MITLFFAAMPFLDSNYENTIDFPTLNTQRSWFLSQVTMQIPSNVVADSERTEITVNTPVENLTNVDYVYFMNENSKRFYYFIKNKKFKTLSTCEITLELDVFQTYMFEHTLLPSFVERTHVDRWNGSTPTTELTDEGLEIGEYMVGRVDNIHPLSTSYIMAASVPLGRMSSTGYIPPPTGGGGGGGGGVTNGTPTAKGYRFIKGYEGFGAHAYKGSGESFYTAGYGITELYQKKYFERLKPFPCSERLASEIYGEMLIEGFAKPLKDRLQKDGLDIKKLSTNQFDALCSLAMNGGLGLVTGAPFYSKLIENPNNTSIPTAWENYATTGGGTVLPGLVARRKSEAKIYRAAEYDMRPIVTINASGGYGQPITDNNGNGYIPPIFGQLSVQEITESITTNIKPDLNNIHKFKIKDVN